MVTEEENKIIYNVVVNDEEQYSMWPIDRELPKGWYTVGHNGTKAECGEYVKKVWTDMKPLSLRIKMAAMEHSKQNSSIIATEK